MKNHDFIYLGLFTLLILLTISCDADTENKYSSSPNWTLVYKNSHDGESLYGSKRELIYALRAGSPLRIGFGGHRQGDTLRSIEHLADAEFISIANSTEVFAQINTIIGQQPNLDQDSLSMEFREEQKFSLIAGTNGAISTLSVDFMIDTLHTTQTNYRGFSWYVQSVRGLRNKDTGEHPPVEPLWKNPRRN